MNLPRFCSRISRDIDKSGQGSQDCFIKRQAARETQERSRAAALFFIPSLQDVIASPAYVGELLDHRSVQKDVEPQRFRFSSPLLIPEPSGHAPGHHVQNRKAGVLF